MKRCCSGLLMLGLMCCWSSGCGGSVDPADAKMEGTPPMVDAKDKFAAPGE